MKVPERGFQPKFQAYLEQLGFIFPESGEPVVFTSLHSELELRPRVCPRACVTACGSH